MPLTVGSRIGAYEITAALGAGGMGEVYRARDTRLGREAAIKILPGVFAANPERLARFEREARVLASLNHPNIAQVYGFEQAVDGRALVMEFVDGEDLAQRLLRGALPLHEALVVARQIAEALEAAHEAGIVHRDLKPGNVRLRSDGAVKVLDFGIAKTIDVAANAGSGAVDDPTITSPAITTGTGVILGTAAYMAPEQARGKTVDKRADIWAFGAVLFEMLTGRRAFDGDSVSDTAAATAITTPVAITASIRIRDDREAVAATRPPTRGGFESTSALESVTRASPMSQSRCLASRSSVRCSSARTVGGVSRGSRS
jgi:serine/threonine protein kinase